MASHQPTTSDLLKLSHVGVASKEKTRVTYQERAYRQDTEQAIKNNPYLALIELITNSDDNMGESLGEIEVAVWGAGKPWFLSVTDNASGIPASEIRHKLVDLASRTSGSERGKLARGNRGRGARDVPALGGAVWLTVHKGVFTQLSIDRNGNVEISESVKVTPAIAQELADVGLGKHGTRVVVQCTTAPHLQYEAMRKKLTNLVALRAIMADKRRKVILRYGDRMPERLQFTEPPRKLIEKFTFPVPGYADKATLTLCESSKPFDEAPGDLARVGGIILTSRRSVHESTLFDFDGNAYAQRLSGDLRWDRIDKLAKEYDDEEDAHRAHPPSNPFPIIKRSREGLEATHPAYVALKKAVMPILAQQVKRLEAESKAAPAQESDETRRRLRELGNVLGDYWMQKNEELADPEDLEGGSGKNTAPLRIVPPRKRIGPGETASFSVEARHESTLPPESVALTVVASEPDGVVKLSTHTLELTADSDDSQRYHGTFRVAAEDRVGEGLIEATWGEHRAGLDVSVAPARPIDVPSSLQFSQERYTVRPKKQKTIVVQAPIYLVERHGSEVSLRVSSSEFTLKKNGLQLKLRSDGLFYEGSTTVSATKLGAKAKIVAEQDKLAVVARVHVADEENRPNITIELMPIDSPQRAQVEAQDGGLVIKINATHSSLKRYLGPHPDYAEQNTPLARVMMGEVAGKELVGYFLKRFYAGTEVKIDQLEWKRVREEAALMQRVHEVMLSSSEVRTNQRLSKSENGTTSEVA